MVSMIARDLLALFILPTADLLDRVGQIVVSREHFAKPHERPHDQDIHSNRARAPQN